MHAFHIPFKHTKTINELVSTIRTADLMHAACLTNPEGKKLPASYWREKKMEAGVALLEQYGIRIAELDKE